MGMIRSLSTKDDTPGLDDIELTGELQHESFPFGRALLWGATSGKFAKPVISQLPGSSQLP